MPRVLGPDSHLPEESLRLMACSLLFRSCFEDFTATWRLLATHLGGAWAALGAAPQAPGGLEAVEEQLWEVYEAFEGLQGPVMQQVVQQVLEKRTESHGMGAMWMTCSIDRSHVFDVPCAYRLIEKAV